MKKKMLVKFISIFLGIVLLISLFTGCTTNKTNDANEDASKNPDENNGGSEEVAELSLFLDFTWMDTESFTGIIPEAITEATGIKFNVTRASDRMQLGVMIASDDLNDIIFTDQLGDRLSNPSICYSWNELMDENTPEWQPSETAIMIAKAMSKDDKYYTLLNAGSTEEEWHAASAGAPTLGSLYYRKDIAEDLGVKKMETMDDYVGLLEKVKNAYPDMVPLSLEYTFATDVFKSWIIPGWIPTSEGMVETDDQVIKHYTSVDEYKDYLKFVNNLYRQDYIKADNFAFTHRTQSEELAKTNKAFSWAFCTIDANQSLTRDLNGNGFEGEWIQTLPLTDLNLTTTGAGWAGAYITKNNKYPEKSIKMMEWMFSDEGQRLTQWGREGVEYTIDEKGIPIFSEEWIKSGDDGTNTEIYNPSFYFGISGVTEAIGRASNITDNGKEVQDAIRKNIQIVAVPILANPSGDSDEKILQDSLGEFITNQETKIILSEDDDVFNKNVEELFSKLEQMGMPKLEEFYNKEAKQYFEQLNG